MLKRVQEVEGVVQNSWYLDDGEVVGSKQALGEVWDLLTREGEPRGLFLSREKSEVFCPLHDPTDQDPLSRGVTRAEEGGIKLLGAPIGDDQYVEEVLRRRLESMRSLVAELHTLEDPHIEYTLLRSCFSFPKFAFALRTVDTSDHPDILQDFDLVVKEGIEGILGAPLPPLQWDQASLPLSLGGLGLRRAAKHGAAAYLASVGDAALLVQDIRGQRGAEEVEGERALASLNLHLGEVLSMEEARGMRQKALSGLIDCEAASRLREAAAGTRDRARLNCVSRAGAGDWLSALPSRALGLHLRKSEFILAVRYRLGLQVFLQEGECPMPRCRSFGDSYGDHAISCAIGGERIAKHNHVRDALFQAAAQAALGPQKEPPGLLPGSDDRPADILLPFWSQGKDTALDITVVNPLQGALIDQVAQDGESGVRHAYNSKMAKYDDRCAAEGICFIPLAVDTFGGWQGAALDVLVKLGRQLARQLGKEEEEVTRQLRQRLSVLLTRDNVAMLGSRCPTLPPASVDGDIDGGEYL